MHTYEHFFFKPNPSFIDPIWYFDSYISKILKLLDCSLFDLDGSHGSRSIAVKDYSLQMLLQQYVDSYSIFGSRLDARLHLEI